MTDRGTRIVAFVLCLLALGASVVVVLVTPADGTPIDARVLELNRGTPIPAAARSGTIERGDDGFVISGESAGAVSLPVRFPKRQPSESAVIRIWAYGGGSLDTVISVRRADG